MRLCRLMNVFDPSENRRRVGVRNLETGKVKTSDGKERDIEEFPDYTEFEKYQNGKVVKPKR
jgi:hypothetical protein